MLFLKADDIFINQNKCLLPWMTKPEYDPCPLQDKLNQNISLQLGKRAEKWEYDLNKAMNCSETPKCNRSIYKVYIKDVIKFENTNDSALTIQIETPDVKIIVDSISYDFQSLVGEVGGTMGLFLGLSTYSIVELVEYLVQKWK